MSSSRIARTANYGAVALFVNKKYRTTIEKKKTDACTTKVRICHSPIGPLKSPEDGESW